MDRRAIVLLLGCLIPGALTAQDPVPAGEAAERLSADSVAAVQPVVRGVLFFSPTCPHCREVMTETLPPVLARYGPQLQIATVNTSTPGGQALYRATIEHHQLPRSRIGVPTLLVGSRTLVGALEIPELLPGIVDRALMTDGIDWPAVPLIRQALAAQGVPGAGTTPDAAPAAEATSADAPADAPAEDTMAGTRAADPPESPTGEAPADVERAVAEDAEPEPPVAPAPEEAAPPEAGEEAGIEAASGPGTPRPGPTAEELVEAFDAEVTHTLGVADRFLLDPIGNAAAVAVLILMLTALGLVAADVAGRIRIPPWPGWVIPALVALGAGVAGYLAYVEVSGAEAICGPVGDCNTVQQSPYATLFGVIPVGVLGLVGYGLILAAWAGVRVGPPAQRPAARTSLWGLALVAALFSVYLTFLEPFVIGASCVWCLTSAGVTTLILLAATAERREGRAALAASPANS